MNVIAPSLHRLRRPVFAAFVGCTIASLALTQPAPQPEPSSQTPPPAGGPPPGFTPLLAPGTDPAVGRMGRNPPNYPTPYPPASVEQIKTVLDRVHGYLEANTPAVLMNRETREEVTDLAKIDNQTALAQGAFRIISYEWGVTYSGMLLSAEITGDARYRDYVDKRLGFIAAAAPRFRAQVEANPGNFRNAFRPVLAPRSLDDSGSMATAMIKAHRAGVGGELRPLIDNYLKYISTGQMRLADGTLARNRPLPDSLWLDDLYMSVPALAQMGKLTGERKYFDDAVKQIVQFADRMFVPSRGLYMHGWVQGMDVHPEFYWGRANGWAIMAKTELLDVLPEDHPGRARVLELLRAHVRGLAATQGHAGLWHQLLDRPESYEETSATAIFTFCIARAINRGWIDPLAHGPMATLGWNAVAKKVNDKGQVEGVCIGTGMGWDPMFYMYRPVDVYAAHGYGPVLLAGAEMIALRRGKGAEATVHDGGVHFGRATSMF
jgi:unsaturated rhamnogalacturonyl hydrolase